MKVFSNNKLIKRNSRVGFWSAMVGPVFFIMGAFTFISTQEGLAISIILILIGLVAYQIGVAFRRYGMGSDITLTEALKKLSNDYSLFHFSTPVSHLLVGPAGIWIIVPRYARGRITFNHKRRKWRLHRTGLANILLGPIIGGIGKPGLEVVSEADNLDRYLRKHWEHEALPHVNAAIVFINDEAEVDAKDALIPTLNVSKLRNFIREQENKNQMAPTTIKHFKALFEN